MRRAGILAAGLLAASAWFVGLRPTTLGGDVSYVIVDGHSMDPTYEDGDLVLVREASSYEVGDVIAFRAGGRFDDPTRIIHRIVGGTPDGYQTQGDNRDRLDPWEPSTGDIIGKAQLHVPMAGDAAAAIARPEFFAAMGGAAVVLGGTRRRRRRRPQISSSEQAEPEETVPDIVTTPARASSGAAPRWARLTHPRWAFLGLIAAVVLAVPTLAMTWSALRAPDTTQRIEPVGTVDYGIGLDYQLEGPPSPVYPDGLVTADRSVAGALTPSDPLYSRLLDTLRVTTDFRATGDEGAERLTSEAGLTVVLETPGGWSTELRPEESGQFADATTATFDLDLDAIAARVAAVADLTGVGGGAYTITVTPTLDVSAGAGDAALTDQLTAPMTFSVDGNLITAEAVEATKAQDLTRTVTDRASYAIGPWDVSTPTARAALSGLALVLVAGIAWFASVLFGGVGLSEPARIAARYRSQIVDVAAAAAPPGPVVMVGGIDELARIAKVEQSVILHEDLGDGAHRYRVFLGSVTYEYETAPEHAGAATGALADGSDAAGS